MSIKLLPHSPLAQVFCAILFILFGVFPSSTIAAEGKTPRANFTFIDVGEGDSIFIESSGANVLIDTGNPMTAGRIVSFLKSQHIDHLDRIIVTHPHPDHYGGIFQLASTLSFDALYDNGEAVTVEARKDRLLRWYEEFVRNDRRYMRLKRGDSLQVGEVSLKILNPPQPVVSSDWNTNSLVMMAQYGTFKLLLMGDGNFATEQDLLKNEIDLTASVLKVGHHGGADATSVEFLKAVKPGISIVSVKRSNSRSFPSPATIARLSAGKLYRTDVSGSISLRVADDGSYDLTTER